MSVEVTKLLEIECIKNYIEVDTSLPNYALKIVEFPSKDNIYSTGWLGLINEFINNKKALEKSGLYNFKFETRPARKKKVNTHCCENGLVVASTPIIIEGNIVAILFVGQVFFKKPDFGHFVKHLRSSKFAEDRLFDLYEKIPIVDKEKFASDIRLLNYILTLQAEQNLSNNRLQEASLVLTEVDSQRHNFVTFMSHELFTPLNAAMAFSEVLKMEYFGKLNAKQTEYVSIINEHSKQLFLLLNDIIKMNEIKANLVGSDPGTFNLKDCLKDMSSLLLNLFKQKGVKLSVEYNAEQLNVFADKKKVKHILLNLLTNALRVSVKESSILLKVDTENDKFVRVSVRDSGNKIPVDKLESIFKIINYENYLADEDLYGKGISLYITKRLVQLNKGDISINSNNKEGNEFWFTLPVE